MYPNFKFLLSQNANIFGPKQVSQSGNQPAYITKADYPRRKQKQHPPPPITSKHMSERGLL